MSSQNLVFHTIVLPVRPQPDTIVAIFILKRFGEIKFPGIREAKIEFWTIMPEGQSSEQLLAEGYVLIDLGSGPFDHHQKKERITVSELVAQYLEAADDPSLAKLLEYARRDDFYGKGTVSPDPIDRALGLSGLISALNKSLPKDPGKIIELVMPLLIAHHNEERKRFEEFPRELEGKRAENKVVEFTVKQRVKKLKIIMLESNNVGMPGFLRSQIGGRYDVVVQKNQLGYVNILTRPAKRIDLRSLAALIRLREADKNGLKISEDPESLMAKRRINEVPNWYYDTATNSILNGSTVSSVDIAPTKIDWLELRKIIELGLTEELISPHV